MKKKREYQQSFMYRRGADVGVHLANKLPTSTIFNSSRASAVRTSHINQPQPQLHPIVNIPSSPTHSPVSTPKLFSRFTIMSDTEIPSMFFRPTPTLQP